MIELPFQLGIPTDIVSISKNLQNIVFANSLLHQTRLCYRLLKQAVKGNPKNAMYVSKWLPLMQSHLGTEIRYEVADL